LFIRTARSTVIHFISDLHLHESQPETASAFLDFLAGPARQGSGLWILGDLFEAWTGDDELRLPFNARIADALAELRASGVRTQLIVGNRDFLLGKRFAARSGVEIVSEPALLDLGGHATVLLHGDAQCTDDVSYQKLRRTVRHPLWQLAFLALPRFVRKKIARSARAQSEMSKQEKSMRIMDVNPDAVAQAFRQSGAIWMIQGHTHRPAAHALEVDGKACMRHVLPDWHDHACGLKWDGTQLVRF
jgi:UDP-2,3-diacylglucosamine hydrolase